MKASYEVIKVRGGHSQLIGYARVSTKDQTLASQLAALRKAGCVRVYAEKCSGVGRRLGWEALLDALRPGDSVVVERLDRIGRRMVELVLCCAEIGEMGCYVKALAQEIDTRSPAGRVVMPLWQAMAETERAILRDRVQAGVEAAREMGRVGGRPPKRTPAKDALIRHLRAQGFGPTAIAAELKLSVATVHRALREAVDKAGDPRQLRLLDTATTAIKTAAALHGGRK